MPETIEFNFLAVQAYETQYYLDQKKLQGSLFDPNKKLFMSSDRKAKATEEYLNNVKNVPFCDLPLLFNTYNRWIAVSRLKEGIVTYEDFCDRSRS